MTGKLSPRQEAIRAGRARYDATKPCPAGHMGERYVSGGCVICCDGKRTARLDARAAKLGTKRRSYKPTEDQKKARERAYKSNPLNLSRERERRKTVDGCVRSQLNQARHRARKCGREYDLDCYRKELEHVIALGACQLTGLPFDLEGKDKRFRPSLDRIDSAKGYTPDNVRVVLTCVNKMLLDYGEDFLVYIARAITDKAEQDALS